MTTTTQQGAALLRTSQQTRARAASTLLHTDRIVRDASRLHESSWQLRLRARATRDWSRAVRADDHKVETSSSLSTAGGRFDLVGELGDERVWARWERGRLEGDARLLTHARLVVELGAVFVNSDPPARVQATLTGDAAPVMLTLAQACDKVISIDFEPGGE